MRLALALALLCATAAPSLASHLESQDEPSLYDLNCRELYFARNKFFHEKGLCFTRPTAIRVFGNIGCQYKSSDDMPMSARETKVMKVIVDVERDKRCPRY